MKNKKEIKEILDILKKSYPEAECALKFRNNYELLVAVTLSAQTTDVSVNKIMGPLFDQYKDVYAMSKANRGELEKIIKTIGMYKTKSKNIINQAKAIVENFEGNVPESDEELQSLPGVGRKTANVVMSVGFGHQRIAVDTHVFRVSNRIGVVAEKDVLKTELALMKSIPEERWSESHHSLIFHGRYCCQARTPKCEECPIEKLCNKVGL